MRLVVIALAIASVVSLVGSTSHAASAAVLLHGAVPSRLAHASPRRTCR